MRRRWRVPTTIVAGLSMLAQVAPAWAQPVKVAVMSSPEDEVAAKRLVDELGAMDLRAELVPNGVSPAPALVRFLGRDGVSVLCCGAAGNERQLEIIRDPDPSLLALRTAERLRALGLGRPPPVETFYPPVKPSAPPPAPRERWLKLRAGTGVSAPSPSFGPGLLFNAAGSLWLAGSFAFTVVGQATLLSPEHRSDSLWIEATPLLLSAGPSYVRASGPFSLHASGFLTLLRSPMRYRQGASEERGWLRSRGGPGGALTGFVQVHGPLSLFADLGIAYMLKDPAVRRLAFSEGSLFAPLVTGSLGVAWTFPEVGSTGPQRASAAR